MSIRSRCEYSTSKHGCVERGVGNGFGTVGHFEAACVRDRNESAALRSIDRSYCRCTSLACERVAAQNATRVGKLEDRAPSLERGSGSGPVAVIGAGGSRDADRPQARLVPRVARQFDRIAPCVIGDCVGVCSSLAQSVPHPVHLSML